MANFLCRKHAGLSPILILLPAVFKYAFSNITVYCCRFPLCFKSIILSFPCFLNTSNRSQNFVFLLLLSLLIYQEGEASVFLALFGTVRLVFHAAHFTLFIAIFLSFTCQIALLPVPYFPPPAPQRGIGFHMRRRRYMHPLCAATPRNAHAPFQAHHPAPAPNLKILSPLLHQCLWGKAHNVRSTCSCPSS